MAYEKVVEETLWTITAQNSDVNLTSTGTTASNTFTAKVHPMRGAKLWDSVAYVMTDVTVAGGATGGSYRS